MKNPYGVFNLSPHASRVEIDEAYYREKEKYRDLRFATGKVGEEATERLEEIEAAYKEILIDLGRRTSGRSVFDEIDETIRRGELEHAQKMLDDLSDRSAEWHYLQSIIFYKKNWYHESKKQLEFAINLDPVNPKYRNSLDMLTKIMAGKNTNPNDFRSQNEYSYYEPAHQQGPATCTGSCCGDVCLANLCCNCGTMCCR